MPDQPAPALTPSTGGRLAGKVALITGGSGGIGLASARLFLAEGAQVLLLDLDEARLAEAQAELGTARLSTRVADVADEAQMRDAVAAALQQHGRLDVLFCNASIEGAINPSPNSTPRMPGTANIACAMRLSQASKKGSPRPTGRPETLVSTTAPTESSCEAASATQDSMSCLPPAERIFVVKTAVPRTFLAMTPAATRPAVMRPEKCPEPRGSANPPYLCREVKSA